VLSVVHDLVKNTSIRTALLLGGQNFNTQVRQLKSGAEVIVATPGRLLDHVKQGTVSLREIHSFVLDEADRMLDMGFLPAVRNIVATIPNNRQTMLFSATFSPEIVKLTKQFLRNPVVIELARSQPSQNVTQMLYPVPRQQKVALLQALLELSSMTSALIFTRTKHGASKLTETLKHLGKSVAVIHGNRSQSQRQQALQGFKDRRYQLLVATDIAARGIDVKDISHVINFDVPQSPEDYVHRIGRTGRAEAVGEAFTLVSPDEEGTIRDIERLIKKTIPRTVIPDFPYNAKPKVFPNSGSHQRPQHGHGGGHRHHQRPHHGGGRPHPGGGQPHRGGSSQQGQQGSGQSHSGGGPSHPGGGQPAHRHESGNNDRNRFRFRRRPH
jgi:ATP-dependent RNA helicase RhlE